MKNFKISTRLLVLVGVLSALLVAVGSIGLLGIAQANAVVESMYKQRMQSIASVGAYQFLSMRARQVISDTLIDPSPLVVAKNIKDIDAITAASQKAWDSLLAVPLSAEGASRVQALEAKRQKFQQEGLKPVMAALRDDDFLPAQVLVLGRFSALFNPISDDIRALIQLMEGEARSDFDAAVLRYQAIRNVCLAAIVFGVLFALLFGLALVRGITRPLLHAGAVANAVARGDLSQQIDTRGQDEIAVMMQALAAMQASLSRVVVSVRQGSENVSSASSEMSQGNDDLSERTERQASTLQQTAASMEQLGATVRQNADHAAQANQLAIQASSVAAQGGAVVAEAVATMQGINHSTKQISDIIGVIDSIAFQTNILALNAAVEAARAGEQGRGFAVVASEVRSLAGRSAEAAKQIKQLIQASVARMEQGTVLVGKAGTTMTEVVRSIRSVTDIVGEISAASSEQSTGVSQVGQAVTQIDQATQQNAALVEQMAAAASSMKTQAQDLVAAVAVFSLPTRVALA
ncbi:methyl-accepting chemotaxis protein-1 (serine sensor receptor) [Rhodoferax ferrireducens]|uniref:Methyl-accepting chemotaxis protein-1 (Serine sensor receptor) n=1 Tax=Rhodoferax ferrireducens TaxID=192843 RepID=A0ABU2CG96_9BURK|nr:methyl-accepting chemotaxis protein [Rhodoferax ferrireducens]MDR7380367.1 methyl-accepting chemotaxis protein-1 (serine sensor receptor) [Rhodoferax ferrireducens]